MNKTCYNCGVPLDKTNRTKEHIPAKNLFQGYPDEYKMNRITVPACDECNQKYSKIDQELRDALAVINNTVDEKSELTRKGIRSILNSSNWQDRVFMGPNGRVEAVKFGYDNLINYHKKNFRALFLKEYGFTLPLDYEIRVIADGNIENVESAQTLYGYLIKDNTLKHSGHPDIFKYNLKDITIDLESGNIFESKDPFKWALMTAVLIYHKEMAAVILAGSKSIIDQHNPNK